MRFRSASVGKVLGGFVGLFGVAAGCTSFGSDSTPPVVSSEAGTPDVSVLPGETINIESLAITDKTVTVAQGRETTLTVKIVRGPFRDEVAISLKNLTKDFTSAPVVIPAGKDTVDIKLVAAATAPLGAGQNVRVLAQSGVASKDIEAPLLVVGAPGSLDLSYGDKGVYRGPEADVEQVYDAALLPDDSVIVAGRDTRGAFFRKITKDGKVDVAYGVGGKYQPIYTVVGSAPMYQPFAFAALPDGRMLAAMDIFGPAAGGTAVLFVISADGRSHTQFLLPGGNFSQVHNVVPIGDDRYAIVGARTASTPDIANGRGGGFVAAVFDGKTGKLDTSWGTATRYLVSGWPAAAPGQLQGTWITVDAETGVGYSMVKTDTNLWLIGDSAIQPNLEKGTTYGLAKLGFDGKFSADYGNQGINYWPFSAAFLGALPTGGNSFLLAGIREDAFVLRKFVDGMPETNFDLKVVSVPRVYKPMLGGRYEPNRTHGFAKERDGFLLAQAGYYPDGSPPGVYGLMARVRADGTLDRSFGREGVASMMFQHQQSSEWVTTNVLVQKSGRVLMVGSSRDYAGVGGAEVSAYWPSLQR